MKSPSKGSGDPKKKQMTEVEKARALGLIEAGAKTKVVAKKLGVNVTTINRLKSRSVNNQVPSRKPGTGQKNKKTTKTDIKIIKQEIEKDPMITARSIKEKNSKKLCHLSSRTIRRIILEDLKMPSFICAQKPKLTKKKKSVRLEFAKKYQHKSKQWWSNVIFSDESIFECGRTRAQRRVRRRHGEGRFEEKHIVTTDAKPTKLMIWACFTGSSGQGSLKILDEKETMKTDVYLEVIEDHLKPTMKQHRTNIFMHDRASSHTSKKSQEKIEDEDIEQILMPATSPDINPIENVFAMFKSRLRDQDLANRRKLKRRIEIEWKKLGKTYFRSLSDSLPRRLKAVIQAGGGMTKY
jgi:transposase